MKNNSLNMANQQDSGCKIFVGGLTWNTTREMLMSEFSKFGEIIDTIVMKNPETGNSRGFGFVTFRDNMTAESAVNSGPHKIDGKIVDVKLCNPRLAAQQRNNKQRNDNCKVFVGGLPHGVTDEEIKQFFSRYGFVKEFKMMYDENKQRPRGFGFITFEQEESANQVLQEHYIQFNGKQIEVKPQIHNLKQQLNNPHHQQQHQQQQMQQQHYGQQPNYGNVNWGQSWNTAANGQLGAAIPNAINNGSWGSYGNNMGAAQQWGYASAPAPPHQAGTALHGAPYANAASAAQSNWNYNFYEQNQIATTSPKPSVSSAQKHHTSSSNIDNTLVVGSSYEFSNYLFAKEDDENDQTNLSKNNNNNNNNSNYLNPLNKRHGKKAGSTTSSVAGTIGSTANYNSNNSSNYSDDFSDDTSYYNRTGSQCSTSSSLVAPSISSGSIVSSASVLNRNLNRNYNRSNDNNNNNRGYNNSFKNSSSYHYKHRGGSSIGSSSIDHSSIYSMPSSSASFYDKNNTTNNNTQSQSNQPSSYHPYRR